MQAELRSTPELRVGRTPIQARARARVERILSVATELIVAEGLDAMRMSDVAQRAGIPIGSLYQYFPDKVALVASLAERFNAEGRACVAQILDAVSRPDDLMPALEAVVMGFFDMYVRLPAMRAVWQATQASPVLQAIDVEDCAQHAAMLEAMLVRLFPNGNREELQTLAALLMNQIAAAVRFAISFPHDEAHAVLSAFTSKLLAPAIRGAIIAPAKLKQRAT